MVRDQVDGGAVIYANEHEIMVSYVVNDIAFGQVLRDHHHDSRLKFGQGIVGKSAGLVFKTVDESDFKRGLRVDGEIGEQRTKQPPRNCSTPDDFDPNMSWLTARTPHIRHDERYPDQEASPRDFRRVVARHINVGTPPANTNSLRTECRWLM